MRKPADTFSVTLRVSTRDPSMLLSVIDSLKKVFQDYATLCGVTAGTIGKCLLIVSPVVNEYSGRIGGIPSLRLLVKCESADEFMFVFKELAKALPEGTMVSLE